MIKKKYHNTCNPINHSSTVRVKENTKVVFNVNKTQL